MVDNVDRCPVDSYAKCAFESVPPFCRNFEVHLGGIMRYNQGLSVMDDQKQNLLRKRE